MVLNWKFLVIFAVVITSSNADNEYCYSLDEKPYSYFGTKTPYSTVRSPQIIPPKDCSVQYVWALIRHGARYASEDDELTSEILKSIRDEIVQNHKKLQRGKLCKEDLEDFQDWKYPWEDKLFGKLMPPGWRSMENLAENLKNQLLDFLKTASKDKFKVQSTTKSRCQNSAIAFTNELYKLTSNDVDDNNIQINNYMLRTEGQKKATDIDELNKFKKSILMDDVLSQISSRLGFAAKLDFDFILKLYKQCVYEKVLNIKSKSAFCAAFTHTHMKIMEYCQDLDAYYTFGYGEPKFKDQACPLVLDLYKKLENAQTKSTPSESGSFYFANNQILLTFLTKLGMFRDNQPLTSDNYATLGESRTWRTSLMSPFGANFIAVMYKCPTEMAVSFYHNEALVKFPSCKEGLCSWNTWRDGPLKTEILKDCPVAAESEVKDVQKKEEKEASENAKKDKSDSANADSKNSADEAKETLRDTVKKIMKDLIDKMEVDISKAEKSSGQDGKEDEKMKLLKEIKGKLEENVKETAKKESNPPKNSKGGAAGLQSMGLKTIFVIALFTGVGFCGRLLMFGR